MAPRRGGLKKSYGEKEVDNRSPNEEVNKQNKRCKTCEYGMVFDGCYACNYIGIVKERRGCPGGDECTKYQKKSRKRRRWTSDNMKS